MICLFSQAAMTTASHPASHTHASHHHPDPALGRRRRQISGDWALVGATDAPNTDVSLGLLSIFVK